MVYGVSHLSREISEKIQYVVGVQQKDVSTDANRNNSNSVDRLGQVDDVRDQNLNSNNTCAQFPSVTLDTRAVSFDDVIQEVKSWSRLKKPQCSSQSQLQSCDSILTRNTGSCHTNSDVKVNNNSIKNCSSQQKVPKCSKLCPSKSRTPGKYTDKNLIDTNIKVDSTENCSEKVKTRLRFDEYEFDNKENENPMRTTTYSVRGGGSHEGVGGVQVGGSYESVISARGFRPLPKVYRTEGQVGQGSGSVMVITTPVKGDWSGSTQVHGIKVSNSALTKSANSEVQSNSGLDTPSDSSDCKSFKDHNTNYKTELNVPVSSRKDQNTESESSSSIDACKESNIENHRSTPSSLIIPASEGPQAVYVINSSAEPTAQGWGSSSAPALTTGAGAPTGPASDDLVAGHSTKGNNGHSSTLPPAPDSSSSGSVRHHRTTPSPLRASLLKLWEGNNANTSPADQALYAKDFF